MATAAAAVMAKARRDVVSHFMAANAVGPDSAVGYDPGRRVRRRQFERLQAAGVLRQAPDGRHWIDLPRYDEWSRALRRRASMMLGGVAVIGAALALLAS